VKNSVQLTLKEIVNSELMWIKTTDDLLNLGITGLRSTSLQITENVLSFADLFEADFESSEVDREVSELANAIVASGMGDVGKEIFGDVKAKFNPAFLRRNADWFLR
jgi:predicted acetyltransferase